MELRGTWERDGVDKGLGEGVNSGEAEASTVFRGVGDATLGVGV